MGTVTHKHQVGVKKSRVPLEGTSHTYRVSRRLWGDAIEETIAGLLIGKTLHVCCGKSLLGDVRLDIDPENHPDIVCDASDMSLVVSDGEYETVLCDPPYNGVFQWNHDLLSELSRVASRRIVFQHWFIPSTAGGAYRKAQEKFELTDVLVWQPKTYFGRVQVISVFDRTTAG